MKIFQKIFRRTRQKNTDAMLNLFRLKLLDKLEEAKQLSQPARDHMVNHFRELLKRMDEIEARRS